ncbi:MAG: permease [Actinomycetota bacterium]|nr:permease [Actinomycetota bacterium]
MGTSEEFPLAGLAPLPPLERRRSSVLPRIIIWLVLLVGLVLAWLLGSAVIPRWWAQRLGDLTDGRLIFGSFLGFAMGGLFTIVPLIVVALGWRFRGGLKRALVFIVLAVVLASPNLTTLGIVLGSGNAAHAGERILDVDAPGIRGGSLVGSIVGALLVFGFLALARSRRRNTRKARSLAQDLKAREIVNDPS